MIKRWVLQKLENMGFVTDTSSHFVEISFDGLYFRHDICCLEYIKTLRECGFTVNVKKLTSLDRYLLVGSKK